MESFWDLMVRSYHGRFLHCRTGMNTSYLFLGRDRSKRLGRLGDEISIRMLLMEFGRKLIQCTLVCRS
jgi:hypothetical protein